MAKPKTTFFCQNCGAQHSKWQGQCNSCREWNTLVEEVLAKRGKNCLEIGHRFHDLRKLRKPLRISEIEVSTEERLNTNNAELDRVLGGGIVPGSLTLLGGEPGIGKSTLLLQISLNLNYQDSLRSGEESQQQIKMRAQRINPNSDNCYILTETKTQNIFQPNRKTGAGNCHY